MQGAGQDLHRAGRDVADVDLRRGSEAGAGSFHGGGGACQDVAGLVEEDLASRRQAHGFTGAGKQGKTEFVLQVTDLTADAWLRDVECRRRARDVLLLRHGDEVPQVTQFHGRA